MKGNLISILSVFFCLLVNVINLVGYIEIIRKGDYSLFPTIMFFCTYVLVIVGVFSLLYLFSQKDENEDEEEEEKDEGFFIKTKYEWFGATLNDKDFVVGPFLSSDDYDEACSKIANAVCNKQNLKGDFEIKFERFCDFIQDIKNPVSLESFLSALNKAK